MNLNLKTEKTGTKNNLNFLDCRLFKISEHYRCKFLAVENYNTLFNYLILLVRLY